MQLLGLKWMLAAHETAGLSVADFALGSHAARQRGSRLGGIP